MKDGLKQCSRKCMRDKAQCTQMECRYWVKYPDEFNCCLVSIYENGSMTLRQIGDRLGISFARVKQIETEALKKIKKRSLFDE
jgi:hypothetical protein